MTETQADSLLALAESLAGMMETACFLLHVSAFALSFLSGCYSFRLWVLAKNQQHLW